MAAKNYLINSTKVWEAKLLILFLTFWKGEVLFDNPLPPPHVLEFVLLQRKVLQDKHFGLLELLNLFRRGKGEKYFWNF